MLLAYCIVGPGHKVPVWGTLGVPRAIGGLLVSRFRVLKTLGLFPTHWQVKRDPEVSASLLAVRAGSWRLAAGLREIPSSFWIIS